MAEFLPCPVCGNAAKVWHDNGDPFKYDCFRCGSYEVMGRIAAEVSSSPLSEQEAANISGFLRETPAFVITSDSLKSLRRLRQPSVAEKADKLIRHLARIQPTAGEGVQVCSQLSLGDLDHVNSLRVQSGVSHPSEATVRLALELIAISWSKHLPEVLYLLDRYLRDYQGLLAPGPNASWRLITPKGWEFIESSPALEGRTAFVAMWFDPSLTSVYLDAIEKGIEDAGYVAKRVDRTEHNNDINDEVLAGIRTSKFVVADFTENRQNVYYEAGFAAGLGKTVVRTIREDHAKALHFDTRQLNHIVWKATELPAFRKALRDRIVGTIGQGPLLKA